MSKLYPSGEQLVEECDVTSLNPGLSPQRQRRKRREALGTRLIINLIISNKVISSILSPPPPPPHQEIRIRGPWVWALRRQYETYLRIAYQLQPNKNSSTCVFFLTNKTYSSSYRSVIILQKCNNSSVSTKVINSSCLK